MTYLPDYENEHMDDLGDYDWGERSDFTQTYAEGDECPECEGTDDPGQMIQRSGKYGRFMGCSNFPDCTHTGEEE